jgi:hypothetical protein
LPAGIDGDHGGLPDHSVTVDFHPAAIRGQAGVKSVVIHRLGRGSHGNGGFLLGRRLRGLGSYIGRIRRLGPLIGGGGGGRRNRQKRHRTFQRVVALDHRRHDYGWHSNVLEINDLIGGEFKSADRVADIRRHYGFIHTGID